MRKILFKIMKIILWIMFTLFIIISVFKNLHTYSPYYAKQLNKEGEHREVMFLVKDLFFVNKPDSKEYYYDYDGQCTIATNIYGLRTGYEYDQEVLMYRNFEIDSETIFTWNQELELIDIVTHENEIEHKPVTEEIESQVRKQLLEDIQPVMDIQDKPIINLQWLFNYLYGDNIYWRFSNMK